MADNKVSEPAKQAVISVKKSVVISAVVAVMCSMLTAVLVGGLFFLGVKVDSKSREAQRQTVVQEGDVIADVAAELSPSVVSVRTSQTVNVNDVFGGSQQQTSEGAGTGIIVSRDGLVLTNKHVIPEGTTKVVVTLADGTVYDDVSVLGRDPLNDLALLQIKDPKKLTPAKLGNSDSVRTGEKVIAIGNALGEFQNTVTSGIISGVGRPIQASDGNGASEQLTNLFQTDAAINPGNSGGPLVNFNGEVIGINTAVAQGAEGLGFAIPINEAKPIVESAQKDGKITRAYLGVRYSMLNETLAKQLKLTTKQGAYVDNKSSAIIARSPADKAGLNPGDVITKVDGVVLSEKSPLTSVISEHAVGDRVTLTVVRGGQTIMLQATLAEAPAN